MAHVRKFTKAACGHMFAHYERAKDESGEYVKFGNEKIDTTKSHLNYNLAPERGMSQGDFVRKRCSDVHCMNRKDVNVMCSWVVTMPRDLDASRTDEFMRHTYEFLSKRYGEENVVSAYVHMDETQPHMHFAFVPVVHDEKKGYDKVSAKEAVTRKDLQAFHEDLQRHLEEQMRCSVNIQNEATREGNKSIEELKRGTAQKEVEVLRKEVKSLKKQKADLMSREEFSKNLLTSKRVESIKTEVPMFGKDKVLVSKADFEALKKTAAAAENLMSEISPARKIKRQAKEIVSDAKEKAKEILDGAKREANFVKEKSASIQLEKLLKKHPELAREIQPRTEQPHRRSLNVDLGR